MRRPENEISNSIQSVSLKYDTGVGAGKRRGGGEGEGPVRGGEVGRGRGR